MSGKPSDKPHDEASSSDAFIEASLFHGFSPTRGLDELGNKIGRAYLWLERKLGLKPKDWPPNSN
jgi:hypothetical protein